jgi:DNA primase
MFCIGSISGELPSSIAFPEEFRKKYKGTSLLDDSYVLPLTNPAGETTGVQFRAVSRETKGYSDYFTSRLEPTLLGLGQAIPHIWETGKVCLVEGGFDLFPVQRVLPYTVPTLTAKVTELLARWLHRMVHTVILFYDNDSAGRAATSDFLKGYQDDFEIRVIEYPVGVRLMNQRPVKDPADLWEVWGDDKFSSYLKRQVQE